MRHWFNFEALRRLPWFNIQKPKKPADFTSRAEKVILESHSATSDESSLDGKGKMEQGKDTEASAAAGMECVVTNLYPDKRNQWTEKYPSFIKDPPENDQTARTALIVRHRRVKDSRKKLEIDSIVVQSPLLKRALGIVFKDYPGITTDLDRLEFKEPFEPFVHRWSQFEQATVGEENVQVRQHLALLWNVLETELRPFLQKLRDYLRHGVMDHSNIWTIFEPNSLMLVSRDGSERLYRCIKGNYNDCGYSVEGQFVEWDGERFGYATNVVMIGGFRGTVPIASLRAVPLARHPDKAAIEARVLERAKAFQALSGYHFKAYDGLGIDATGYKLARFNVEGRVIIDTAGKDVASIDPSIANVILLAFNSFNPNDQVKVTEISRDDLPQEKTKETNHLHPAPKGVKSRKASAKASQKVASLSKDLLLITNDTVRAYCLRDKKWLSIFVHSLHEITWDERAFPSLVLPANTKDLILAFADSQIKRSNAFDDVIQGKGRGTIMLLSGPPGVGKTLTAESVAEVMRVPLYMLSAGDLGTDPKQVEDTLSTTLTMTTKWKAVLLLDEADVFLLARNTHDLERNKLVSIFLRVLEYYQGFLFLTTNRIEDIDRAFESRIHLSLQYSELDAECRKAVWKSFLAACETEEGDFGEEQLGRLAQVQMNGRQIKNVIKPAQLLASKKEERLRFEHVEIVMNLKAKNAFVKKEM